jgi:cytochrome bd-type quinol oxidase subunit 2
VQESAQDIKGTRLVAVAVGVVSGIGSSYLMVFLDDRIHIPEGIPSLVWMLVVVLLPIILIGLIAIISRIRKSSLGNDAPSQEFLGYFELSFFILYYVTYTLSMLNRVG